MGSRGEREEGRDIRNVTGAGLLLLDLKVKEEGSAWQWGDPGASRKEHLILAFLDFSPEKPRADFQPTDL